MKKNKTLIILVAVLFVCIAVYTAILLIRKNNSQSEETPSDEATDIIAWKMDNDLLSEISYTVGEGEYAETLTLVKNSDSWTWAGNAKIPLYDYITNILIGYVCYLPADHKMTGVSAEDFAKYGLDTPTKTVNAKAGEVELTVNFGRRAYNDTYYATVNGDKTTVYLISADVYDYFDTPLLELIDLYTLPSLTENTMHKVTVRDADRRVDCTYYPDGNEKFPHLAFSWYVSVNDGEEFPLDTSIAENLSALLCGLEFLDALSVDPDKKSEYGIDSNTTLTVEYASNNDGTGEYKAFTLDLGDTDKNNYYYASLPHDNVTYLLGGSAYYKLFNYSYEQLAPRQVVNVSFSNVGRLEFTHGEENVIIVKDTSGESTTYTVNGETVKYSDFADLITALKTLTAYENTTLPDEDGNLPVRNEGLGDELVVQIDFSFESFDSVSTMEITKFNEEYNLVSFLGRETQLISVKDTETFIGIFTELVK